MTGPILILSKLLGRWAPKAMDDPPPCDIQQGTGAGISS
jgi:hypothetical protein